MSDWRIELVGSTEDVFGEKVEVSIEWNAGPDAVAEDEDARILIRGEGGIELDQEGAEAFASLFVSACWRAARREATDG
jgi:hypothetical protein